MEALGKALKEFRELQMPHQETSGLPDYLAEALMRWGWDFDSQVMDFYLWPKGRP